MKFSYQWLRELVPGLDIEPAELQRLITMKTAECEGIEPAARSASDHPDWVIDIDNKSLTHRPDLWGHVGMAREVAAITGNTLHHPVRLDLLPDAPPGVSVQIGSPRCSRYSALVFENVSVRPSPPALAARLESVGMNAISNIVDVTNYILAELPQPMHAFDADKLAGDTIYVRLAHPGERLDALNGETYDLAPQDLVIADASGPVALAGVIGGAPTAISESTARVVLESANFDPTTVRLTSARHKLRTDASVRFEKSLDPENTLRGLGRAVELFAQVSPGIRVTGGVTDARGAVHETAPILLSVLAVARKLGIEVSQQRITHILESLGFAVAETSPGLLTVRVPSWRATKDISHADDLVEEIGRMIGYGEITPRPPLVASVAPPQNPMRLYLRQVRSRLAAQGFTEVSNYSFVNQADVRRFGLDISAHVAVRNPIASEQTHLRRSLLPGIFSNIVSNVRHYRSFRIFEIGAEVHPSANGNLPNEMTHAVAALYDAHGDQSDFFELKRVLECVLPGAALAADDAHAYEHPFRTAKISWRGATLGRIFELHPSLLAEADIEGRAVLFDIDIDLAQSLAAAAAVSYKTLRKYPTSGFDLSVVAASRTPVASIEQALRELASDSLASLDFVRQYEGPQLANGLKSVSYHLEVGAPDRTLTAEEASAIRNRIIEGLRGLGFELRV